MSAILVLWMHAGFAFFEIGTVQHKNQRTLRRLGGIAVGIFGLKTFGGMGGVGFTAQLIGTIAGVIFATARGFIMYGILRAIMGIRLTQEEYQGADLSIHKISASPK